MIPEPIDPEPATADRPQSGREAAAGGVAGNVSHTDHLYPPTNWLPGAMVSVHPVGLPHGPEPCSLQAFMDGASAGVHNEVGIMADSPIPPRSRSWPSA